MAKQTIAIEGANSIVLETKKADSGDGYSIAHHVEGVDLSTGVTVTCSCANGTSVTKTCPTASYQCNCTPNASLTCD